MRTIAFLLALSVAIVACGDDAVGDTELTAAEREWCTFEDASEDSALRFDIIFEAGITLELPMDQLNAQAAGLLEEYIAEGMTVDEAARRVSDELLDTETFIVACKQAFADESGG